VISVSPGSSFNRSFAQSSIAARCVWSAAVIFTLLISKLSPEMRLSCRVPILTLICFSLAR
jgi:hypothetical protein